MKVRKRAQLHKGSVRQENVVGLFGVFRDFVQTSHKVRPIAFVASAVEQNLDVTDAKQVTCGLVVLLI